MAQARRIDADAYKLVTTARKPATICECVDLSALSERFRSLRLQWESKAYRQEFYLCPPGAFLPMLLQLRAKERLRATSEKVRCAASMVPMTERDDFPRVGVIADPVLIRNLLRFTIVLSTRDGSTRCIFPFWCPPRNSVIG